MWTVDLEAIVDEERGLLVDPSIATNLAFGADVLAVDVDLALFDADGYGGRVILWDRLPCSREQALVIAAPAARCLEQELGEGRIVDVQVWHVRDGLRHAFDFQDAIQRLGSVTSVLSAAQAP